eukprot:scaffold10939_cov105-Cylindrotheca_fusiformis.AAC.3
MTQQAPRMHAPRASAGRQDQDQSETIQRNQRRTKRFSPFRIKAGCVVALRYRSEGNHLTIQSTTDGKVMDLSAFCGNQTLFTDIWSNPQPGRDEGLNLVGCRIRCCFPKSMMSQSVDEVKGCSRTLEGEVISIVNSPTQFWDQRQSHRQRKAHSTCVGTS